MCAVLAREWGRDNMEDLEGDGRMRMAGDDAAEEWNDTDRKEDVGVDAADDSKGVFSEAGGSSIFVRASRLQTGQKVRQLVSQESTHMAWNLC